MQIADSSLCTTLSFIFAVSVQLRLMYTILLLLVPLRLLFIISCTRPWGFLSL
jgi:hypothetical protein